MEADPRRLHKMDLLWAIDFSAQCRHGVRFETTGGALWNHPAAL
jgi:hypothetical protein